MSTPNLCEPDGCSNALPRVVLSNSSPLFSHRLTQSDDSLIALQVRIGFINATCYCTSGNVHPKHPSRCGASNGKGDNRSFDADFLS